MNQKISKLLTLFFICSILVSCSKQSTNIENEMTPTTTGNGNAVTEPTPEPSDPIKERIASMSVEEKIGQMVIVGLEGTTMESDAKEMIDSYHVGGFILYKDNIVDAKQTMTLLNQLKVQNQNQSNKTPLWLSVDQEGGKVSRVPLEFAKFPAAQQIGRIDNPDYSHRIGLALGGMIQGLGFNMDFAPVLDINSNPKNPVIGSRSFGTDPDTVIKHGIATMKGIQHNDVAAVVKHFPGHGDTSVDSHLELPVVNKSLKELESFELLPFMEAIEEDVDAIMIAHLLIPKIDDQNPASLSKKIITDLLRTTLKYDGVVITDDMTMGGITKNNDIGKAAVRSVLAGSDILLIGHDYELQTKVLKSLKKSVEDGTISVETLDKSLYRILHLKSKYKLNDSALENVDVASINKDIKEALDSK